MNETVAAGQTIRLNASSLLINVKTYIIAEKYNIKSLKEWAVNKYKEVLPVTWNNTSFIKSIGLIFENTLKSDQIL